MNKGTLKKLLVGASLLAVSGLAAAQSSGPDVSAATTGFNGVTTAINSVGPLMLGAAAAGIVYRWVTAFLI